MTAIDIITLKKSRWKLANWLSHKAIDLSDVLLKKEFGNMILVLIKICLKIL